MKAKLLLAMLLAMMCGSVFADGLAGDDDPCDPDPYVWNE